MKDFSDPFADFDPDAPREEVQPRRTDICFYCNGPADELHPLVVKDQPPPLGAVAFHQICDDQETCPEAFYDVDRIALAANRA